MVDKNGYWWHESDEEPPMWPHDGSIRSKTSAAYQHMIHSIRAVGAVDENIKRVIDYLEKSASRMTL